MSRTYRHWQIQQDTDHIFWACLDVENERVNSLSVEVLSEFNDILESVEKSTDPIQALVIRSNKSSGFIAGADIRIFSTFKNNEEALAFIRLGHRVFDRLEKLKIPTIAMIHGFCLGGGLELALACRYRIALNDAKTQLGLVEVMLGFHPGWGGTVRLPRLVGALQGLDLAMTGRKLRTDQAKKIGLIDEAVPERQFEAAVKSYALTLPRVHRPSFWEKATHFSFVRPILGAIMRRKLSQSIYKEHYPAPFAILEHWIRFGVSGDLPLQMEIQSMGQVIDTPTAKNLLRVFGLQEKLKSLGGSGASFSRVHVIGAGTMGAEIAVWCAIQGFTVTVFDAKPESLAAIQSKAIKLIEKRCKKPHEKEAVLDRLIPDLHNLGVDKADVIIEAIFENLEAKRQLFAELEKRAKPGCLLATNTSSIPLEDIASALSEPERLVGIHFFNPVSKMKLVEVVQTRHTSAELLSRACQFVRKLDRLPLPVKSSPGFLVNRLLMPYLMEAVILVEEGVPIETIDAAAKQFGMPMGPIELADTVGLDICLSVAQNLCAHFGGTVSSKLKQMVAQGKLGRKSQQGFYEYRKGQIQSTSMVKLSLPQIQSDVADRLMMRLIRESLAVLQEGVVEDADLLDAGMIFGSGFAPFRGGPMHYFQHQGKENMVTRMNELGERYGERFLFATGTV